MTKKKYLWLFSNDLEVIYDMYIGFVVCARTKKEAWEILKKETYAHAGEDFKCKKPKKIGISTTKVGLILESFNAG